MGVTGSFAHAPEKKGQGENLCMADGSLTFLKATQEWLEEKEYYHGQAIPSEPSISKFMPIEEYVETTDYEKQWGHYSAMIWPEATRVGMGSFTVPADSEWPRPGYTYVVARYDVIQYSRETPWRLSPSNPHGYTAEGWEEEKWILKYGGGRLLW
jgi:Cysteine-rich secretory protein family